MKKKILRKSIMYDRRIAIKRHTGTVKIQQKRSKKMLYIGNHTSSSRGYLAMGKQMLANGGNTFAFFTRNPRGGKAKDIDPQDVQAFWQLAEENHFGKLVAHAPYTMNCCAAKENLRDFAREIMADDLRRLEMTPGNYYNFHPGSHVGHGAEMGISKIAEILNEVLTKD